MIGRRACHSFQHIKYHLRVCAGVFICFVAYTEIRVFLSSVKKHSDLFSEAVGQLTFSV